MHKHTTTGVEPILDETIGRGEMLEQILVLDIVHLDDHVDEGPEEIVGERRAQDREYVGDARFLESLSSAHGEDAAAASASMCPWWRRWALESVQRRGRGCIVGAWITQYAPTDVELEVAGDLVEQRHDRESESPRL